MSELMKQEVILSSAPVANLTGDATKCALQCLATSSCFSYAFPSSRVDQCFLFDVTNEEIPFITFISAPGMKFFALPLSHD